MAAKYLACLLLALGGCASFGNIAADAGRAAADQAYERVKADLPEPAPDGSEELWAAMAGAVAIIGHRYWYHWRATKKGG